MDGSRRDDPMSKDKKRNQGDTDSVWSELARMEAEVNDPEEAETSVYDMRQLAALKGAPPGLAAKLERRVKPPSRPTAASGPALPRARPKRAEAPPRPAAAPDDDAEEDATKVFASGPESALLEEEARRKLETTHTELASPELLAAISGSTTSEGADSPDEDDAKEPTETRIYERRESGRGLAEAPALELEPRPDARSKAPDEPATAALPRRASGRFPLDTLVSGQPPVTVSAHRSGSRPIERQRRPSPWKSYASFALLIVVGFFIGYLVVLLVRSG